MAGLKIFGTDPETQPKPRQQFSDDIVGRVHSGHVVKGKPKALTEFRFTTGDPEVANWLADTYEGDEPAEWDTENENNLEVFTAATKLSIILEGDNPLRQKMQWWSPARELIQSGDGATLDYPEERAGEADPDAELSLAERKAKHKKGIGPGPSIEIYFRLADNPDLGIFKFSTGSWSLASDIAYNGTDDTISDLLADGNTPAAILRLVPVSFVAKNGPMKGQQVSYTKPELVVKGAAK